MSRQAISAIENGGDFKTQTLDNLAIVLGVSVDFIMYGKNEEKIRTVIWRQWIFFQIWMNCR